MTSPKCKIAWASLAGTIGAMVTVTGHEGPPPTFRRQISGLVTAFVASSAPSARFCSPFSMHCR